MEKSSSQFKNPRLKLKYTPSRITKIKSLIQNLDQELKELCNQCTLPRKNVSSTSNIQRLLKPIGCARWLSPVPADIRNANNKNVYKKQHFVSSNSLLTTVKDESGGVKVNKLSSVYRDKVSDAYENRRIFTVYGNYHTIRRALLRRGWLEKLPPGRYPRLSVLSEEILLQHARKGNDYEAMAISKIIDDFPAFFIWQPKGYRDLSGNVLPYRNRIRRSRRMDFTTKIGLIGCAEQQRWYRFNNLYGMSCPRFYRLRNPEERTEFIEEYRRTQCRNLIRFLVEKSDAPVLILDANYGVVPSKVLDYAMNYMKRQLNDLEHNTLDKVDNAKEFDQYEWKEFLSGSNYLTHEKGKLKATRIEFNEFVRTAKDYLDKIDERHPDYKWDGVRNLWILKPGYRSCGVGIVIKNSLDDILQFVTTNDNANRRYLVQKYIGM